MLYVSGHCANISNLSFKRLLSSQALVERLEASLAQAAQAAQEEASLAQEEASEADYEGTNRAPQDSPAGGGWSLDPEGNREPSGPEPPPGLGGRTASQRSRLQDLLLSARRQSSSGCFGARMDRIGNASGLGCNAGRGEASGPGAMQSHDLQLILSVLSPFRVAGSLQVKGQRWIRV
ncbi:Natriuretic peptides A [Liparis tanakae]|uniref:Natriuretic peptides A n=1 Tax=Liparis tanakae TaxID=230148 RepID=A0A4Z2E9S7_9TELE|nr:Natriuretic peptides A [Liparis tanakae]